MQHEFICLKTHLIDGSRSASCGLACAALRVALFALVSGAAAATSGQLLACINGRTDAAFYCVAEPVLLTKYCAHRFSPVRAEPVLLTKYC
jgi:hypothetical protein